MKNHLWQALPLEEMKEITLLFDELRSAASPEEALMEFLQSTYERSLHRKAPAVIGHAQPQFRLGEGQLHAHLARLGVPQRIPQRLLPDPRSADTRSGGVTRSKTS